MTDNHQALGLVGIATVTALVAGALLEWAGLDASGFVQLAGVGFGVLGTVLTQERREARLGDRGTGGQPVELEHPGK